jgi:hypothetical protein
MWNEAAVTSSDIRTRNSSVQTVGKQEKFSTAGVGLAVDTTLLHTKKQRFRREIR